MEGSGNMFPGTTGNYTSYKINNPATTCKMTGGLAFCSPQSGTATNLPWTVHTTGSATVITNTHYDMTFTGIFCPYHEIALKGNATVTPNNLHAVTTGTIAGTLEAYNGTTGAFIQNITSNGSGTLTPSGTYGLT